MEIKMDGKIMIIPYDEYLTVEEFNKQIEYWKSALNIEKQERNNILFKERLIMRREIEERYTEEKRRYEYGQKYELNKVPKWIRKLFNCNI